MKIRYQHPNFLQSLLHVSLALLGCCVAQHPLSAQTQIVTVDNLEELTFETVLQGLNHPSAVAVQPNNQSAVFIAESGSGRVLRFLDSETTEFITGFLTPGLDQDLGFQSGLLSLQFGNQNKLIVGQGGDPEGADKISVFRIGRDPLTLTQATNTFHPTPGNEEKTHGDFLSITKVGGEFFATSRCDDQSEYLIKMASNFKVSSTTFDLNELTNDRFASAIATTPDVAIAVGMRSDKPDKSTLVFLDPGSGRVRGKFTIPLNGLIGLAYSPFTNRLFALINSKIAPEHNGLYKLVARKRNTECEPQLVKKIDQPMDLEFSLGGLLYVVDGGSEGKLIQIHGLDEPVEESISDEDDQ